MPKIHPYQSHAKQYDQWFDTNRLVYEAELEAVESFIPQSLNALEIGVGTGRFAAPLGIRIGIEPAESMRAICIKRQIQVIGGVAEYLPFQDATFDLVLMVTVLCFVDDLREAFSESCRVLSAGGNIVIGMLDCGSPLGKVYQKRKTDSLFYRQATFNSVGEILKLMRQTGFDDFRFQQTVFHNPAEITVKETVRPGYGDGLFAVIRGKKA